MSALIARQEPYRALQVLDAVPAGHTAIYVGNDRFDPHLAEGEFAVVDTDDKSHERGELYAYQLSTPLTATGWRTIIVQICRGITDDADHVWFRFEWKRPGVMKLIEGPLGADGWRKRCVGRVVGVLVPDEVFP